MRPRDLLRFGSFVQVPSTTNGCWIWIGSRLPKGYGKFSLNSRGVLAHRVSFELFRQQIPKGLLVLHRCDNPSCVNPGHLFLGNHAANMQDMASKKRGVSQKKTHCPQGHKYSLHNTWQTGRGWRQCRECNRIRGRKNALSKGQLTTRRKL